MTRVILILCAAALVAGCGTIDGVGQDISSSSRVVRGWFGG